MPEKYDAEVKARAVRLVRHHTSYLRLGDSDCGRGRPLLGISGNNDAPVSVQADMGRRRPERGAG